MYMMYMRTFNIKHLNLNNNTVILCVIVSLFNKARMTSSPRTSDLVVDDQLIVHTEAIEQVFDLLIRTGSERAVAEKEQWVAFLDPYHFAQELLDLCVALCGVTQGASCKRSRSRGTGSGANE